MLTEKPEVKNRRVASISHAATAELSGEQRRLSSVDHPAGQLRHALWKAVLQQTVHVLLLHCLGAYACVVGCLAELEWNLSSLSDD